MPRRTMRASGGSAPPAPRSTVVVDLVRGGGPSRFRCENTEGRRCGGRENGPKALIRPSLHWRLRYRNRTLQHSAPPMSGPLIGRLIGGPIVATKTACDGRLHGVASIREALARLCPDSPDPFVCAVGSWRQGQHARREWRERFAGREDLRSSVVPLEPLEVVPREGRCELALQEFGVLRAEPEHNHAADVAEHRVTQRDRKLAEVLVGQHETESELAALSEQRRHRVGDEMLELVDVHDEGGAAARSLHRGELESGEQQPAEQVARVLADPAGGQVREHDATRLHEGDEVEPRPLLPHDGAHDWTGEKAPELVEHGRKRLALKALAV